MAKERIITGLDIGSSKISVVVADTAAGHRDSVEIIGVGNVPSEGVRRGVVVDINQTAEAIRKAIDAAELMAGVNIENVCVGISGDHLLGQTSHGVVSASVPAISERDVDRAITAARAISVPGGEDILHVLEQNFIVDQQNRIKEPVGISGTRLEAYVYIITSSVMAMQNLLNSIEKAGIQDVEALIAAPLASTQSVLSQAQREVGIALVDIGDGTTEIVVYKEDAIQHMTVFPVGGQHVTNDIAQYLRVTLPEAEELKLHRGCAWTAWADGDNTEAIPIGQGENRTRFISRIELAEIIEYRMEEILVELSYQLENIELPGGLILTGGTALMDGLTELAEDILPLRAQIGYPKGLTGLIDRVNQPMYANSTGLVLYGNILRHQEQEQVSRQKSGAFGSFMQRILEWLGY